MFLNLSEMHLQTQAINYICYMWSFTVSRSVANLLPEFFGLLTCTDTERKTGQELSVPFCHLLKKKIFYFFI